LKAGRFRHFEEDRFVFSRATKHCDGKVFEQTLADTRVWMWRGYRAK